MILDTGMESTHGQIRKFTTVDNGSKGFAMGTEMQLIVTEASTPASS